MSAHDLIIEGAKQNNLKNISLTLPHNKFITITGVSGSGKSSLAFDTIFAEGQWRFIESLSTYARLFLEKLDRPEIEAVRNIRPAIALEQRNPVKTSRSTVGTSSEIYDYLRLLYSKIAHPHCPVCDKELTIWNPSTVVQELTDNYAGEKAMVIFETDLSPDELQKKGFHRIRERDTESRNKGHEIILDRLVIKKTARLSDSIETAWDHGNGSVKIELFRKEPEKNITLRYHSELMCDDCDLEVSRPQPLLFSFNHPLGACTHCNGFGNSLEYAEDYIIPDRDRTLEKGAIEPWSKPAYRWWYRQFAKYAKSHGINLKIPYKKLPEKTRQLIFKGDEEFYGLDDFFEEMERKRYKLHVRVFLSRYRKAVKCQSCEGSRLRPEALAFKISGMNIFQLTGMSIAHLNDFFNTLMLDDHEKEMSAEIVRQIQMKLAFLMRVGTGYLTLNREAKTLSGGESQRINLSNQLASKLTGTLYVLDEPTVGLHPSDVGRISEILRELSEAGNSVITVEHDKTIIDSSDWVVELGPGGGENGGNLVFSGTKTDFLKADTLTALYLNDPDAIEVPFIRRQNKSKKLSIRGATGNNLKNININIPLHTLTCITGVSGSGKSTIVKETIYPALARHFKVAFEVPQLFKSIKGVELLKGVRIIDQSPIGKSPRSNPVTYIKAFDPIRKVFAEQPGARMLGYTPGHFSFNTEGGRCETCAGAGFQRLEMYFFEDLYVTCDACEGKKYKPDILNVTYNGRNISEVLELTVDEAILFFRRIPVLVNKLNLMSSVGLGYLRLGQPATTLSGGEAQRLKICAELGASQRGNYLYILDEPTVGLHPHDIRKLIKILNDLVDSGNTVLIVEHNLDVIKCADWIIDVGPEGGDKGGQIVAEGTPEQVAKNKKSYTGRYLKDYV
ncbi:MAG: excinuclease ABC subunit UvrA [Nitrospiraceae bacterium]|nr:MAG: excinuclease ABC subunit UvrA [Nitrospiraceae bacterium]